MGGLSMNPDHDGEARPKLATQIAEKEDWKETTDGTSQKDPENLEPKPVKKMKIGFFEFDSTYLTSLQGIMRVAQVIAMLLAFIFALISAEWPDQGSYSFFCVFLVLGVFISGYFLITLIGGYRGEFFCGISWFMVELVYFISFGILIFVGSCLAANHANSAFLTLSAILGFAASVTFIYWSWTAWKLRKEFLKKKKEEKENEEEKEDSQVDPVQTDNFEVQEETKLEEKKRNNSLPANQKEQIYQNQMGLTENEKLGRRHSLSDKDSAYSEGIVTPTKGKYTHHRMRRSASAFDVEREFDHRCRKQPFHHLNYGEAGPRVPHGKSIKDRTEHDYPRELSTNNFADMSYNPNVTKIEEDDLGRRRSMPDWLRAALGTEVEPSDHVIDDESEVALPRALRVSTLPDFSPKEFPLLAHSDEESINYPSVSQNFSGKHFHTMPFNKRNLMGDNVEFGKYRHRKPHLDKRKRGHQHNHHHNHHHRHFHHGKKAHHHRHNHGHRRPHHQRQHHHREGGRRPISDAHEDYLRRMVENDELVVHDRPAGKSLTDPHANQRRRSGKKRVFPKRTTSIQFPEQSRWDDDNKLHGIQNQMMEKYLQDAQIMRQ